MSTIENPPSSTPINEPDPNPQSKWRPLFIASKWLTWFQDSVQFQVERASQLLLTKLVKDQTASIASTPFTLGTISAGHYEVIFYARITTAAGVSGSVIPTIAWTENGVSCTHDFATLAQPSVTASEPFTFYSDAASPISYSTTYASNPAATMVYRIHWLVTRLD